MPLLPSARGPHSARMLAALGSGGPGALEGAEPPPPADPLGDDDLQLALYLAYELHYRGLPGVDEEWEWDPGLLAARRAMERRFESALLEAAGPPPASPGDPGAVSAALRDLAGADAGPSLSAHLEGHGTRTQLVEFVVHRSAYQLKEADPHSFAIPRLSGPPKAALVEIQSDEYGAGRPERIHAELFRRAMAAMGLDDRYGAYLDLIPGVTLATVNLMSMLGLHRRHRGGIVGHLALFEMTSCEPNRRYAAALRRLGLGPDATEFFDEHVEADAAHENLAAVDLAGGLARAEPAVAGDILWGARALAVLDARWSRHLLDRWAAERTSLRRPLSPALAA